MLILLHTLLVVVVSILETMFPRWQGWSGGAKVLGKLPLLDVLLIWISVGQGPIVLAVGAGGGCFGHFVSHLSLLFSFTLSLGDGPI